MDKQKSNTSLNVARTLYLTVCLLAGTALSYQLLGSGQTWVGVIVGLSVAVFFMFVESLTKTYTIRGFSTGTFGLLIGLFCAWLLSRVGVPEIIGSIFAPMVPQNPNFAIGFVAAFNSMLFASLGFLGSVIALRSGQDDFAVVIPYVRFRNDAPTGRPLLLDTDIITDGRVVKVINSGFFEKNLIIPRFVLEELQVMSNSPSPGRNQRGQKGLECLEKLRGSKDIKVTIHDSTAQSTDDSHNAHLLQISQILNAQILTTNNNLTKVAKLQGVEILNLNDMNEALKPTIDIGTRVSLPIVRTGREDHQGVGYLPDGTMIVVNKAVSMIGTTQHVNVISTINTSAGLMVFADIDNEKQDKK